MAKIHKLLDKMHQNPKSNWDIKDIETVARFYNLEMRRPKGGSSHVKIRHANGRSIIVPARRPIKPIYIRKFHEFVLEEVLRYEQ